MKNKTNLSTTEEYINILEKKFEKSIIKFHDPDYAFNRCKQTSEAFFDRLPSNTNVEIIRLEGLLLKSPTLHKKWISLGREFAIHYALCVDNTTVIDYTFRQFDTNKPHPYKTTLEEYLKNWENYSVYKSKDFNNSPKLATNYF